MRIDLHKLDVHLYKTSKQRLNMKSSILLITTALLASLSFASPSENVLDKRSCVPCPAYCCANRCKAPFNRSCAGSMCITNAAGYSYCQCVCRE
ncbi:hypothetical protein BST61_g1962 [Cercospora zeina]